MAKSVQATVDRWKNSAGAAQTAWQEGVQGTTVDVMGRAIAAAPAAVQGFTEAITSGRWARAITASGGTANWKSKATAKAANYSTGIAAGSDKFQASMSKLLPALESMVSSLPARGPAGSPQNKARVISMIDALHARKGDFKG